MKHKRLLIILLFFFYGINSFGQNAKEVLNLEKAYGFVNSILSGDTSKINLSNEMNFGIFVNDTALIFSDTLFTKEDVAYFRQQFSLLNKISWQVGKITRANVISHRKIKTIFRDRKGWNRFRRKYGQCLTSFSLPIFNKSFNYCVFYYWTQCDYLNGSGGVDLYKLSNGSWVVVKRYSSGFS